MVSRERARSARVQLCLLLVGCLVVSLATAVVVGGDETPDRQVESWESADSSSSLEIELVSIVTSVDAERPAAFVAQLHNPENRTQSGLLTVGLSPPDEDVDLVVDGEEPWYHHEEQRMWATQQTLAPGEVDLVGVVVYPGSTPGHYQLNASVGFLNESGYQHVSDTASLTVEPASSGCEPVHGWLACHWPWLLPLLGLIVAVLSFFGYERVRDAVAQMNVASDSEGSTGD